jgi:hypothetical protein
VSQRSAVLAQAAIDIRDWDSAAEHAEAALAAGYQPAQALLAAIAYNRRDYATAIRILEGLPSAGGSEYALLIRLHLLAGDAARAWKLLHECCRANVFVPALYDLPRWLGEPLAGRHIVAWGAGYGDDILFARFLGPLVAAGAIVTVNCRPALVRLFRSLSGVADVLPLDVPFRDAEFQVHFAELPGLLGISEESGWAGPYLHAEPLRPPAGSLRVGLVWGTDAAHFEADIRSASLADMAPLAAVPDVCLFSLQFGSHAAQAAPAPAGMLIKDLTVGLHDFADSAAAIASLDLIVSIDTATANLAGAMGAPVWVALPFVSDFRWSAEGARPKWYPSARPYRQPARGDWKSVFVAMAEDLAKLTEKPMTRDRWADEGGAR